MHIDGGARCFPDQIEGLFIGEDEADSVEIEEDGGGQPCEPPVAVDQGVVAGDRVDQSRCLQDEARVGVLSERALPRSRRS
jgi:hypothetical protein